MGFSSRGRNESDTTERLHFHFHACLRLRLLICFIVEEGKNLLAAITALNRLLRATAGATK